MVTMTVPNEWNTDAPFEIRAIQTGGYAVSCGMAAFGTFSTEAEALAAINRANAKAARMNSAETRKMKRLSPWNAFIRANQ